MCPRVHDDPVSTELEEQVYTALDVSLGSSTAQAVHLRDETMTLSQEDITACREAFDKFDKDGSGTVRGARSSRDSVPSRAVSEPFLVPEVPSPSPSRLRAAADPITLPAD